MAPVPWRAAMKAAPVALEVVRQVDRRVRPHVRAYQLARAVDGYVGSWTDPEGVHWVVFPDRDAKPLRAFPPLSDRELETVHDRIDRETLRSHHDLPEELVRRRAEDAAALPSRVLGRGERPRGGGVRPGGERERARGEGERPRDEGEGRTSG